MAILTYNLSAQAEKERERSEAPLRIFAEALPKVVLHDSLDINVHDLFNEQTKLNLEERLKCELS